MKGPGAVFQVVDLGVKVKIHVIAAIATLPFLAMCSNNSSETAQERAQPQSTTQQTAGEVKKNGDLKPGDGATPAATASPGATPKPSGVPTATPSSTATPTAKVDGAKYFADNIIPMFEQVPRCYQCHAPPRTMPVTPAPLSIFQYEVMRLKLATGPSSTDNDVMNKMRGRVAHTGGDRCDNGVDNTPCKEIRAWWKVEFPDKADPAMLGEIKSVTDAGTIGGYAQDAANPTAPLQVRLYLDAASGTGPLIATVTANKSGYGTDSHAFSDPIPLASIDGKQHKVYGYALIGGVEQPLTGSPFTYTAYKPNLTNGKPYFDSTVGPGLAGCDGACHVRDYAGAWSQLLTPPKYKGGTATSNMLILKGSGGAGVGGHGGGNVCGGVNGGVCASIQQWWNLEFPN